MMRHPMRLVAAIAIGSLALSACGGTDDPDEPEVEIEDVEEDAAEPEPETDPLPDDDASDDADAAGGTHEAGAPPEPDPALVAEPCAPHQDREMEVFIELVAPVNEQLVTGDDVELVGCSNVFEATVNYRLLDGDGRTLDEGFTTATCGTGCVGEFRETLDLSVAEGEPVVYLQVFWISPADDGGEEDLTEVMVVLG
jgi:hypothetical protein